MSQLNPTGRPAKVRVLRKFLDRDEQAVFFDTIGADGSWRARRDYHAFRLMRHAGIRVGTLVRLTVADAQQALKTKNLHLRAEVLKQPRGSGHARTHDVPVEGEVVHALVGLLGIRRERGLGFDPEQPLLCRGNPADKPVTVRSVQLRCRYWAQRSGLPLAITPHWMRHTLGQRIVANDTSGRGLLKAAGVLGHSSLDSTAIYTAPTRTDLAASVRGATL